jgi:hypothetical protein
MNHSPVPRPAICSMTRPHASSRTLRLAPASTHQRHAAPQAAPRNPGPSPPGQQRDSYRTLIPLPLPNRPMAGFVDPPRTTLATPAGTPGLRHGTGQGLAHRHRDGHNGREMEPGRRRGRPEAPRPHRQRRLRRLLALPPTPRARTHPPRQIPRDLHPRSVTSSPHKSRTHHQMTLPTPCPQSGREPPISHLLCPV